MKQILLQTITPFGKMSQKHLTIMFGIQVVFLMMVWSLGTYTFFPSPLGIFKAFTGLLSEQGLIAELWVSLKLTFKSMLIATLISAIVSYLSTIPLTSFLSGLVAKGRFLTIVGLSFFFTLLTSSGNGLKTSILVFFITVFFTTGFSNNVNSIEEYRYNHARTLGLSSWRTLWEVVIYGKLGDLLEMVKQNFAIAWAALTMVEGLVRSEGGIGVLLLNSNKYLQLDNIFAIQLLVFMIGIGLDYSLGLIKEIVCPYTKLANIKR